MTFLFGAISFPVTYVLNKALTPLIGQPLNPQPTVKAKKLFSSSLSKIENIWLKNEGKFLQKGNQPSIADLNLVCEIMELKVHIFTISMVGTCSD